jgi:hypothetical protein
MSIYQCFTINLAFHFLIIEIKNKKSGAISAEQSYIAIQVSVTKGRKRREILHVRKKIKINNKYRSLLYLRPCMPTKKCFDILSIVTFRSRQKPFGFPQSLSWVKVPPESPKIFPEGRGKRPVFSVKFWGRVQPRGGLFFFRLKSGQRKSPYHP